MPEAMRKDPAQEGFRIEPAEPIGHTKSPNEERPTLHLIKSDQGEPSTYQRPTREQTSSYAQTLADNTHLIPADQRTLLELRLVQDRILDNSNQARTQNVSTIRAMLDQHPEEAFLLKTYMEDAAIAFGLRLVDDKIVSESIRQARSRMKQARESGGLSRAIQRIFSSSDRWADETAIIKDIETVAAELAGQKIALAQGAVELSDMSNRKEELLLSSTNEATRIIEKANQDAERIRAEAKQERTELEARNSELRRDNATLEGIRDELLKNSDTSAIFDQKREADRKKTEERLLTELKVLNELWSNSYTKEDSHGQDNVEPQERIGEVFKNVYTLMSAFKQRLLLPLAKFETQFNSEERVALANKLTVGAKEALGDSTLHLRDMRFNSHKKEILKADFFSKVLFALADERVSMEQAIIIYDKLTEGVKELQIQLTGLAAEIKPVPTDVRYDVERQLEDANNVVLDAMNGAIKKIGSLYSEMIAELTERNET